MVSEEALASLIKSLVSIVSALEAVHLEVIAVADAAGEKERLTPILLRADKMVAEARRDVHQLVG
jgi:hypothetical protein